MDNVPETSKVSHPPARDVAMRRLVVISLAVVLVHVVAWGLMNLLTNTPWRLTTLALTTVPVAYMVLVAMLWQDQRQKADGRTQFGLRFLLVTTAVLAAWLAIARYDHNYRLRQFAERAKLAETVGALIGDANTVVNDKMVLNVRKPTFADRDLEQLLDMRPEFERLGVTVYLLNLDGTAVTDRSVSRLTKFEDLEMLFLGRTVVTDVGVEPLLSLRRLRTLDLSRTSVSAAFRDRSAETHPGLVSGEIPMPLR